MNMRIENEESGRKEGMSMTGQKGGFGRNKKFHSDRMGGMFFSLSHSSSVKEAINTPSSPEATVNTPHLAPQQPL